MCASVVWRTCEWGEPGEPPPFWFVGLSFVGSREKEKKNRRRDRTNSAALLSLTLYMEVSLVMLATLDVTARADVGCHHTALGVFFRFQVSDFNRRLGFFSLCHFIFPSYLLWVVSRCVVSVTPKGN